MIQFAILKHGRNGWTGTLPPIHPDGQPISVHAEFREHNLRIYAGRGHIELAADGCDSWAGKTDRSYLRVTALPPDLSALVEDGLLLAIAPLESPPGPVLLPEDLFFTLDETTLADRVQQAHDGLPDEDQTPTPWPQGYDAAAALFEALGRFACAQAQALRGELQEEEEAMK